MFVHLPKISLFQSNVRVYPFLQVNMILKYAWRTIYDKSGEAHHTYFYFEKLIYFLM